MTTTTKNIKKSRVSMMIHKAILKVRPHMINNGKVSMRLFVSIVALLMMVSGCGKTPDIQGAWFFDYEATRVSDFPNAQYESARVLIADIEPRYGTINVDGSSMVMGGAVCKIKQLNDDGGLECDEHGTSSELGLFLQDEKLVVKSKTSASPMIFSRTKQDPFAIYGVEPNAKEVIQEDGPRESVAVPAADSGTNKLVGYARTQSFNAFFESGSIVKDGRYTTVHVILNYLEPQAEANSQLKSLSSVQAITFDCPGSNYRLDKYAMMSEPNGRGEIVSESGDLSTRGAWTPVSENSVNKVLYMQVCR